MSIEIQRGSKVGKYTVSRFIASGGFGSVYRACDEHERLVALKVLHPELRALGDPMIRFVREASALSQIEHPNVVRTLDSGFLDDGRAYIAMEYLDGIDLEERIETEGRLSAQQTLEILRPLCGALAAAHELGIVHRDVKASNVFLDRRSDTERVVLLDFGIAKFIENNSDQLTSSRMGLGTPTCIAPEQIRGGDVDIRTDIYGLGALAYRMLSGKAPFSGGSHTMLHYMHLYSRRPSLRDIGTLGPRIDAVISRAMATEPDYRFTSVDEFLVAFAEACQSGTVTQRNRIRDQRDAIGIYIETRIKPEAEQSDALLDIVDDVLDHAQARLLSSDFSAAFEGSNATLFASVLPEDAEEQKQRVREAVLLATEFHAKFRDRSPDLHLNVCVHRATVLANDNHFRGGELLRLDRWAPDVDVGVCFTNAAIDGIDLESEPVEDVEGLRRPLPRPELSLALESDDDDAQARQRHQEMMAQLGRQSASLLHDLRSPVTTILACIGEVLDECESLDEDSKEALEDALEAATQLRSMTREVLNSSSIGSYTSERKPVRVADAVDRAVNLTRCEVRQKATVHVSHEDEGYFMGSLGRFTQVLTNLLVNAAQAIERNGEIHIRTQTTKDQVKIAIRDTGCGIGDTAKQRIFEPYFSTKGVAEGTGLGLATVLDTVKDHGGSVSVDSSPGAGTCFTISLPSAPADKLAEAVQ